MKLSHQLVDWIKRFITSFLITIAGFGTTYLAGQVSTLKCVHTGDGIPACQFSVSFLDRIPLEEMSIQELKGAELEEDCDDEGCTYRVILITGYGPEAFTIGSDSDRSGKQEIVDEINQFLASETGPDLFVKDGAGFWVLMTIGISLTGLVLGGKLLYQVIRYLIAVKRDEPLDDHQASSD